MQQAPAFWVTFFAVEKGNKRVFKTKNGVERCTFYL